MSIWYGIENGVATADMNPQQLAPTSEDQLQWPLWGMYHLSLGQNGQAPDLPEAQELIRLQKDWRESRSMDERTAIWHQMLSIFTSQVFSIGLINGTLQPVLHTKKLQNLPEQGLYGFDPTCYLGIYMPDTFWLETEQV